MPEWLTWPSSPLLTKQDTVLTSKRLRVDSGNVDEEGGEREKKRRGGEERRDSGVGEVAICQGNPN